ncbi:MAG: flagellar filament capping protein FliD [Opitutaceae bacterium]|nr:flagellar filament capping protein FliD [Opitutaceae bacterium]
MSSLQLSGLASGFDWKTFVDQMIGLERSSGGRMEAEIATNQMKLTALSGVETRIGDLRKAMAALDVDGLFEGRSATSSATGWSVSAGSTASPGTYAFNVTQRATAAAWKGAAGLGASITDSADVSGVTLASMGTALAPTAGVFTVNGARVTVALGDSLQDVFDNISTATSGDVTAAYDPGTDKVTLTSGSGPVVLGSATDTSNFLQALRLSNNGAASTTSSAALGAISPTATLSGARLPAAITAVDGSGAGSFTLNGVSIAYNVNTDSLNQVMARINASSAGVTASYDAAEDRVVLLNRTTGDVGFALSEAPGGLLGALGLTTTAGASLERGKNAQFTVNGGPVLSSASNTLDEKAHGVSGLSVTAPEASGATTVTVAADTGSVRTKIDAFIGAFNSLQSYIDNQTKVTSSNGKVTAATLAGNREIQNWTGQLRNAVFASVPGLSATLSRLDHIGIDFSGTDANLVVKSASKLETALKERPSEVSAFFRQSTTGMADRLEALFTSYVGAFGTSGLLGGQRTALTKTNASLTQQIADLDRRLEQRRSQLETSFIAMEQAQSTIQQMQSQLTNAFSVGTTSKK